jgi:hypothetical protein
VTSIVMYRGDDRDFELALTEGGQAIDLTDYTIIFTARADIDDAEPVFALSSTVAYESGFQIDIDPDQVGAGKGKLILHILSADTIDLDRNVTLLCDIELTDPDGHVRTAPEPSLTQSTLIRLKIRGDVTRP